MKTHITLGIDPGIANTGLAIVESNGTRYSLITAETLKTKHATTPGNAYPSFTMKSTTHSTLGRSLA